MKADELIQQIEDAAHAEHMLDKVGRYKNQIYCLAERIDQLNAKLHEAKDPANDQTVAQRPQDINDEQLYEMMLEWSACFVPNATQSKLISCIRVIRQLRKMGLAEAKSYAEDIIRR